MEDERKRVLEMVADGTITAAEGARLLDALGSTTRKGNGLGTVRRKTLINAGAMLSEMGPMIQETMGEIFKGSRKADPMDGLDFQKVKELSREIGSGHDVVIQGTMKDGRNLSISLSGTDGNILSASVDGDEPGIQVSEQSGKTSIRWESGNLVVKVPECAGSLKVATRGGSIISSGVAVPVTFNTMGGGIDVSKPGASFSAKSMGGTLSIELDGSWKENSKAKSMGGGITITMLERIPVEIEAGTIGGSIQTDGAEHRVINASGGKKGGAKMTLVYGSAEDPPRLSVNTMGGDIAIKGEGE